MKEGLKSVARRLAAPAPGAPPMLLTVIHTEEEFDWASPFDSRQTGVTHMRDIGRVQEIFARHDAKPTYVVDYPIASQSEAVDALTAAIGGSRATIGAHLHPWVSPPVEEAVTVRNSYPGNLPPELERAKLQRLGARIAAAFGTAPTVYLAGRYGFGPNTLSILQEFGYRVDLSPVAMADYSADGGPDYSSQDNHCTWEGTPPILRIPHSVADIGLLCRGGQRLFQPDGSSLLRRLHVPGILARLGAMERLRLSPEGFELGHLKACATALCGAGVKVLVLSFHSPSVTPGFTPYVRDQADLREFLARVDGFLRYFRDELHGAFATPDEVLARMA